MKVLAITPTFFPQLGGLEQVVFELARRMPIHGVRMDIAHVAGGQVESHERIHGIEVFRLPLIGNRVVGLAPALPALVRRYDLLHVHDPQLLALSGNVRWLCGRTPSVLSTHGGFWHTDDNYWLKRVYESTFLGGYVRYYDRVLATSVSDFEYFRRYSDRVELCSNGVDVKGFGCVSGVARTGMNRWIYWGRLSRNKRVDLVIDYAAEARRRGWPVELLVCGRDFDGLMPELTAQVEKLSMGKAVRFESYLDEAALRTELESRNVYITASEHEGFGLSVVEAMAAGLVVVCRDMAPLNGFFTQGESGWSLRFDSSVGDFQSLEKLLALPADKVNLLSGAAREAAAKHDWDVVTPRFLRHYREILAGRSADAGGEQA